MGGGSELGLHRVEHADAPFADLVAKHAIAHHIVADDVVVEQPGLLLPSPFVESLGERLQRVATADWGGQLKPMRDDRHLLDRIAHRQQFGAHLLHRPAGGAEQLPLLERLQGERGRLCRQPGPQGQPPGVAAAVEPGHLAGLILGLPASAGGVVFGVHAWLLNSGGRQSRARVRCKSGVSLLCSSSGWGIRTSAKPDTAPHGILTRNCWPGSGRTGKGAIGCRQQRIANPHSSKA